MFSRTIRGASRSLLSITKPKPMGFALRQPVVRPQAFKFGTTRSVMSLTDKVTALVPEEQKRVGDIFKRTKDKQISTVSVTQAWQGMRGVTGLVCETSLLDAEEGIRFRGLSIPECQEQLPTAKGGKQPVPEAMLWLLLTGQVPTQDESDMLSKELQKRASVPDHVNKIIDTYPKTMHPMTQFSSAVLALQTESTFAKAYADGVHKKEYWKYFLEDSLNLIACLPQISARIFNNVYRDGKQIASDKSLDWSADFCKMTGFDDPAFHELMRLYFTIHTDHEGGNVSAHTTHLVGSALSDPYLAFSAGMNGLAGPLHGLANQEVLRWVKQLQAKLGDDIDEKAVEQACWDTLNSGRVIPGFGHAVLRKTDPRYTCQRGFALENLPEDEMFKLVALLYDVVPKVLTKQGKVKNPWPNVDAHSGVLLNHYGFVQEDFYTVLFGMSRAIGVCSSLTYDRILGAPIERPKSVTWEWIEKNVK